jgi:predicted small secreted protein
MRDRSFGLTNLRVRLAGLLLVLLPIVLAACNKNNGSGPGY